MQTFLPYPSFTQSMACLDNKRLGKQRVEAMQILRALQNPNYGWQHHPAVKMWRGYEDALAYYHNCAILEWESRGFRNNMAYAALLEHFQFPVWLGNPEFHKAHRAALLAKDYDWYKQFGWLVEPKIQYLWPVR